MAGVANRVSAIEGLPVESKSLLCKAALPPPALPRRFLYIVVSICPLRQACGIRKRGGVMDVNPPLPNVDPGLINLSHY